jgi:hypothetical protein
MIVHQSTRTAERASELFESRRFTTKKKKNMEEILVKRLSEIDNSFLQGIEITINDEKIELKELINWEVKRAKVNLNLYRGWNIPDVVIPQELDTMKSEDLLFLLHQIQGKLTKELIEEKLSWKLFLSKWIGYGMIAISPGEKHQLSCIQMRIPNCSAEKFYKSISMKMGVDKMVNFLACPDHYWLENTPKGLEVIETPGSFPFPSRFFLQMNDISGVVLEEDPSYPFQMYGTALSEDDSIMGGIRHQFRAAKDDPTICEAILAVSFPEYTPFYYVEEHQWHLACEWTRWFQMFAIDSQQEEN